MSDETVTALGVDTEEVHKAVIEVIDNLSKHTHVRPTTIDISVEEADALACETIATFLTLLGTLEDCRGAVRSAVGNAVNDHALEIFTQEIFSEIDILSTRSSIDGVQIGNLEIMEVGSTLVTFRVAGDVYVELTYGSKSDFQNDMGAEIRVDFPFTLTMSSPVNSLKAFQDANPSIDTSSWYEDGDDDDLFAKITDY